MIRNVVFDIGNVLTDFRRKDFLRDKGFDEVMAGRIAKASVLNPIWNEGDRGEWDWERLMQEFVKLDPEIEKELYASFRDVTGIVTKRDYAIPWIQELKMKGFGVYYLSNFSYKIHMDCMDALDFLPYTDRGILSYRVGTIKPGVEIYRLLLSQYNLKAEECIFLDDTFSNVEAAKKLGFHGICFKTKKLAEEEMRKLGVG